MFADTELAPALQLDVLRQQAAAALPPLTPHQILPSSSPPRDLGDETTGAGDTEKGAKSKDGEGLHKRRTIPKLDDARLLDTDGFPALVKQAKHFKPRGKGHEVGVQLSCRAAPELTATIVQLADLNRLMQVYQFWSHKLYPRQTFRANVVQIEKLCHSKRMTVSATLTCFRHALTMKHVDRARSESGEMSSMGPSTGSNPKRST